MQPTLQDIQLMSKHRVFGFKPQLRLEWRGQDGQSETEQPVALHLDCSRAYIGKLEAEGVIQRKGDGFPLDRSRVAYLR